MNSSIASLLIGSTLLTFTRYATETGKTEDEKQAIEAIETLGGKFLSSHSDLNLSNSQITDAGMEHLKGLTKLSELNLNNTQITDAGLQELKTSLPKCQISNEGNETPEGGRN